MAKMRVHTHVRTRYGASVQAHMHAHQHARACHPVIDSPYRPVRCTNGIGSVLRGIILNNIIFIGHYRGQPIQQAVKTT